jgi:hypothetical protein
VFNQTPKDQRQRMLAEEAEQARIRRKRERVEQRGYGAEDGRVNDLGGYGVTLNPDDGTVTVGDAELEEPVTLPLASSRARLETLAEARDRVTAARVAMLGVWALAVPKRDRRRALVIEARDAGEAVAVVDGTDEAHLRQWVAWFNRRAAAA